MADKVAELQMKVSRSVWWDLIEDKSILFAYCVDFDWQVLRPEGFGDEQSVEPLGGRDAIMILSAVVLFVDHQLNVLSSRWRERLIDQVRGILWLLSSDTTEDIEYRFRVLRPYMNPYEVTQMLRGGPFNEMLDALAKETGGAVDASGEVSEDLSKSLMKVAAMIGLHGSTQPQEHLKDIRVEIFHPPFFAKVHCSGWGFNPEEAVFIAGSVMGCRMFYRFNQIRFGVNFLPLFTLVMQRAYERWSQGEFLRAPYWYERTLSRSVGEVLQSADLL